MFSPFFVMIISIFEYEELPVATVAGIDQSPLSRGIANDDRHRQGRVEVGQTAKKENRSTTRQPDS